MTNITEKHLTIREKIQESVLKYLNFVKFVIVGGSGTVVNMLFLWVFYSICLLPLEIAALLAIEVSIINNYIWNELWTFRKSTNKAHYNVKFMKYHVSVLLGLGINYVVLLFLSRKLGLYYLLANLIGIGFATLSNYLFSSRWAWKNE